MAIPIESFSQRLHHRVTLKGTLQISRSLQANQKFKSILLITSETEPDTVWSGLAGRLADRGYDILLLRIPPPRSITAKKEWSRFCLESAQTGVLFLKSDERVTGAKVSIIASTETLDGVYAYVNANSQMVNVIDSLILVTPKSTLEKNTNAVPFLKIASAQASGLEEQLVEFLRDPLNGK